MAEKIANKFEKAMKKGFVNIFVLLVLNKEPTHGYQIKKLIEERTSGFWSPTDSTMYTILNNLRDKDLIKLSDNQDPDDARKVYELTKKGKETLELMIQREREMRESMRSILFSTTELDGDFFQESFLDIILKGQKLGKLPLQSPPMNKPFLGPFNFIFSNLKERSKEEQLKILITGKKILTEQMESLKQLLENIDKKISDIESE
jgi:DNA-binding PadR family transcriptional regulator